MDLAKYDGNCTTRNQIMNTKLENQIIFALIVLLIILGLTGCSSSIQNCKFNPGVTVEQKKESKEGEVQKETELESKLPVKVSPKGEVSCNF